MRGRGPFFRRSTGGAVYRRARDTAHNNIVFANHSQVKTFGLAGRRGLRLKTKISISTFSKIWGRGCTTWQKSKAQDDWTKLFHISKTNHLGKGEIGGVVYEGAEVWVASEVEVRRRGDQGGWHRVEARGIRVRDGEHVKGWTHVVESRSIWF